MSDFIDTEGSIYSTAEDLHPLHWEKLAGRPYEVSASEAGCNFDGEKFTLTLLGREMEIYPKERRFNPVVKYQYALSAITYLYGALGADPSGDFISFRELPGGASFFRGPHVVNTEGLAKVFGENPEDLSEAVIPLGGEQCEGGDVAVTFTALPRIPMKAMVWRGEEKMPPSAILLIERRANLHMALDALWALSNVAISSLIYNKKKASASNLQEEELSPLL